MTVIKNARNTKPAVGVVIPARMDSERLPGKAMLPLAGRPMIERVYRNACAFAAAADASAVVATDSDEIISHINKIEGNAHKTSSAPVCGTERVCEAAEALGWGEDTVVVNLQCDEPGIRAEDLRLLDGHLRASGADIATLATRLEAGEVDDPQRVKVVVDARDRALYFSRSRIPHGAAGEWLLHVGVYAYRVSTLKRFVRLPACAAEKSERLEQLRALHHGMTIHVGRIAPPPIPGVDTEADLESARRHFERP